MNAKMAGASAGVACTVVLRLAPAKKVFLALVTTTPVTLCGSPAISVSRRATAAAIERW